MTQLILTLNSSFEPLQMLPYKDAMRLLVTGKAELVEGDAAQKVRSELLSIDRPHVIRLTKYVKVPDKLKRAVSNTFLFARDGYRCQYCGKHESVLKGRVHLEREHIMPVSRGGKNSWTNCTTACTTCNAQKSNKTPAEAGMKLRSTPVEPNMVQLRWEVRRMTPMQRKYITRFFGKRTVNQFADQ
jgi:5-methylcytosine-specific restriction endonuclease McrA